MVQHGRSRMQVRGLLKLDLTSNELDLPSLVNC